MLKKFPWYIWGRNLGSVENWEYVDTSKDDYYSVKCHKNCVGKAIETYKHLQVIKELL